MWKDRIRPGNPEKLGVTRAGRELNFAVAVQDGKDCSLLLYRKGMDEPELELGFTDDMRFGEICAMGLDGLDLCKLLEVNDPATNMVHAVANLELVLKDKLEFVSNNLYYPPVDAAAK